MKALTFICFFIMLSFTLVAQTNTCPLNDGKMHEVYVFTENRHHSMNQLFGNRVNNLVINIVYVTTAEQKEQLDKQVNNGDIKEAAFIFPDADASKTIRYCNVKE